jgi:hypothetical protein
MNRVHDYREKYEAMTGRKVLQDHFDNRTTHLISHEYAYFIEMALVQLEKKNIELQKELKK